MTSGTPHLPTTVISDVSRAAVAVSSTGPSFPFTGAAPPTLHSAQLGTSTALQGHTRSENDSEHIISHNFSQLNDKHFKLPASVADLNSNENSNADGGGHKSSVTNVASHQLKSDISGTPGPVGVEGLGVGLSGLQVHEAYAELGETFVNSADSSLDVDKLINTSTGSERLRELLKPSSGGGREVSREELDDFFDSSLPSALHDSKEKDSLRSVGA